MHSWIAIIHNRLSGWLLAETHCSNLLCPQTIQVHEKSYMKTKLKVLVSQCCRSMWHYGIHSDACIVVFLDVPCDLTLPTVNTCSFEHCMCITCHTATACKTQVLKVWIYLSGSCLTPSWKAMLISRLAAVRGKMSRAMPARMPAIGCKGTACSSSHSLIRCMLFQHLSQA